MCMEVKCLELFIKLLGIIFPIILFMFRYVLPARFEKAFSKKKREEKQIIVELIHFPNELLMVSVGYTIPKTIEYIQLWASSSVHGNEIVINLLYNIVFSILIIICLPFLISQTKLIENYYFSNQRLKVKIESLVIYVLCIIAIIISLVLGV